MSKNLNRAKLNKAQTGREYRNILIKHLHPIYYDEGWSFYTTKHHKYSKQSGKSLYKYEVRKYRTWKYNRKTQYKP